MWLPTLYCRGERKLDTIHYILVAQNNENMINLWKKRTENLSRFNNDASLFKVMTFNWVFINVDNDYILI